MQTDQSHRHVPCPTLVVERAHQAAVEDAWGFIEKHPLFTRTGPLGIRQVNVRGLVATAPPGRVAS